MRRMLTAMMLVPLTVVAVEPRIECPDKGPWTIRERRISSGDIEEFEFTLTSPKAAQPPLFSVSFDVPQLDAHHRWTTLPERVGVPANWSCDITSRLSSQMPLVAFLNDSDRNRICVSASEALRTVRINAGVREEDCHLVWKLTFFSEPEAPLEAYTVRMRVDRRDVFFGDAIAQGSDWISKTSGLHPVASPAAAFDPLYSTWYSFHQNVTDRDIEAECREASKLGMKVLIVDDGWQTDDNNRGYAFTGDWEVSKRRFPDMAGHVKKVHEMGMKYMVWYGVPMVGLRAKNHGRFKGKYLWTHAGAWSGYSALDPRFPEVRDFIASIYERAVREWDLDGLKLDFIDSFSFSDKGDPAVAEEYAGRDMKSLPLAVDRLMKEVYARLKALKPDILIEFRQSYIGPAIRQYGNMLRAGDCPGDLLANRCRTANLRLTSGETAVHADMLEWHRDEKPEVAARFVLSALFSTIQYSVMLRTYPESHKRMIAHWLKFTKAHRETLLHGSFRPHHFEAFFPWMEAESPAERIAAVYVDGTVVPVDASSKPNIIVNATGEGRICVDASSAATAEVHDTFGEKVGTVSVVKGLNVIELPVSGYLEVRSLRGSRRE